jgi:hypothetical protein
VLLPELLPYHIAPEAALDLLRSPVLLELLLCLH